MKLLIAMVLVVASMSALGQCDSEQFAISGGWQHMSAVGPATATLAVYDSATGSPQTVTLTGTGK